MNVQLHDFPSDSLSETFGLRKELLDCLRKSETSTTARQKFKEQIAFTMKALQALDKELAAKAAQEAQENDAAAILADAQAELNGE